MSTTPVKVKRAIQDRQETPIVPRKKRRNVVVGVYIPPVVKLRRHYDLEFGKFLQSAKAILDHIELTRHETLLPLRRQLRRNHKESSNLQLYFKSLTYWKSFYSSYVSYNDKVMDCFRFDDLRSVQEVVKGNGLPEELVSFVTQQLMEWRDLFKNVEWMKTYSEMSVKIAEEEQKQQENAEREELLRQITLSIDMSNLKISDFEQFAEQPEQMCSEVVSKVREAQRSNEMSRHLKNMPSLSRRMNTKEWCRKHYENPSLSSSSSLSDDESSTSSDGHSSLNGDGNTSTADISSSSEGDVESFFGAYGM